MDAETHKFITQKFYKNIKPKTTFAKTYKVKKRKKIKTKQKALTMPYETKKFQNCQ